MTVAESTFTQDDSLIGALCSGDENAFAFLLNRYHASLVRVAAIYVQDPAIAEEVAQETWLAVLKGIRQFQGRSSLKTWIFSILTNQAKTRVRRESRSVPFSALQQTEDGTADEPAVPPSRFKEDGWWRDDSHPHAWNTTPENLYLSSEVRAYVRRAIDALPMVQRQVITLRDVGGLSTEDICSLLGISETNQRVLLHRARSKVRRALEQYFDER